MPVWKVIVFSLTPTVLLLIGVEFLSLCYFASRGPLTGRMAFHPLFHAHPYKSDTFSESRFMYDPYLGYRFTPNARYGVLTINNLGFVTNGHPFPDLFQKPKNTTRIFMFGGSTVAGSGSSTNAHTLPASLEHVLNQDGSRHYEVINAGVDGYAAYTELAYYLADIHRYKPDIVIFYDGWNDYFHPCEGGGYASDYQMHYCWPNSHEYALYLLTVVPEIQNDSSRFINLPDLWYCSYTTMLIRELRLRLHGNNEVRLVNNISVRYLSSKKLLTPQDAAIRYADFAENSIAATSGHGVKVLYLLQPTIYDKPSLTEPEQSLFNQSRVSKVRDFYNSARQEFQRLQAKYNKPHIIVADLSQHIWSGVNKTIYVDECHTNDEGNELLAKKIASLLKTI